MVEFLIGANGAGIAGFICMLIGLILIKENDLSAWGVGALVILVIACVFAVSLGPAYSDTVAWFIVFFLSIWNAYMIIFR